MATTTPIRTEQTDSYCLAPDSAARLLADAPWRRFAVIGDSLAAGVGDPSPGYVPLPWGERVARVLRRVHRDLAYLNTGAIGATTAGTLVDQTERMLAFNPDLLHISCGANDAWRRRPDFTATERAMRRLFDVAARTGARLTTFTLGRAYNVAIFPDFTDRVRTINRIIRAVAADHDTVLVDMWDHPVNHRPDLLSADRIHFSTSGQAVMAAEIVKALAATLDPARRPAAPPYR